MSTTGYQIDRSANLEKALSEGGKRTQHLGTGLVNSAEFLLGLLSVSDCSNNPGTIIIYLNGAPDRPERVVSHQVTRLPIGIAASAPTIQHLDIHPAHADELEHGLDLWHYSEAEFRPHPSHFRW